MRSGFVSLWQRFTVAEFELAPLVATLGQTQVRNTSLSCALHLSHFDKPLSGAIRVDLYDAASRIDSRRTTAKQGLAIVGLEIEGDGPHHLEITMVDDSSATATIPLPGSEKQQREETVLTNSGMTTTASLMPGRDTREALGLHVRSTELNNSPVRITDNLRGSVRIEAMQAIEDCCVGTSRLLSVADLHSIGSVPSTPQSYRRLGNISTGEVVEVKTSDWVGMISIGGFVDGNPWEARAVTLRHSTLQASIEITSANDSEPDPIASQGDFFAPGSTISVNIEMGTQDNGHAALVIRDARLQPSTNPKQQLAANIKNAGNETDPGKFACETCTTKRELETLDRYR